MRFLLYLIIVAVNDPNTTIADVAIIIIRKGKLSEFLSRAKLYALNILYRTKVQKTAFDENEIILLIFGISCFDESMIIGSTLTIEITTDVTR